MIPRDWISVCSCRICSYDALGVKKSVYSKAQNIAWTEIHVNDSENGVNTTSTV